MRRFWRRIAWAATLMASELCDLMGEVVNAQLGLWPRRGRAGMNGHRGAHLPG
jgi:hypothetical protein